MHPYVYARFFQKDHVMIPFGTDSSGKAFDIDADRIKSMGGIVSDVRWTSVQSEWGPNVSVATISEIQRHKPPPSNKRFFYLTDDKRKLMVGVINDSGALVTVPNQSLTFDMANVPNVWMFTAPAKSSTVADILVKPAVYGIGKLDSSASLSSITDVTAKCPLSDYYFVVRVPDAFADSFFHPVDKATGIIADNMTAPFDIFGEYFASGWMVCSVDEAKSVIKGTTIMNSKGLPGEFPLTLSKLTMLTLAMKRNIPDPQPPVDEFSIAPTPEDPIVVPFKTEPTYFLMKSPTACDTIPHLDQILQLDVVLGTILNRGVFGQPNSSHTKDSNVGLIVVIVLIILAAGGGAVFWYVRHHKKKLKHENK